MRNQRMKLELLIWITAIGLLIALPQAFAGNTPAGITPKKEISKAAKAAVPHITAEQLQAKIDGEEKFYLIDVRTMPEYQAGHIDGSMWIPRGWVEFKTAEIIKDANAEIIVYCKSGSRGSLSAKALLDMGYKNVKDLDGGIIGWVKKEYPLYSIFGKIQVVDIKAKDSSPNGTGQVRNVYP